MAGKPAFHTPEAETHQELHGSLVVTGQHGRPPVPLSLQATTLIDPLLQDLDLSSRRYLSYFAKQFCQDLVVHHTSRQGINPFQQLVPMCGTHSFLREILIAAAALHCSNFARQSSPAGQGNLWAKTCLVDALRAKHRAIKALQTLLARHKRAEGGEDDNPGEKEALLATILFFVNFALIDGDKRGWRSHMEAAERLVGWQGEKDDCPLTVTFHPSSPGSLSSSYSDPEGDDGSSSGCTTYSVPTCLSITRPMSSSVMTQSVSVRDYIASDFVAYYIWGSAIDSLAFSTSGPSTEMSPSLSKTTDVLPILLRTEANSYHSCPAHILHNILRTSRVAREIFLTGSGVPTPEQLSDCLELLREAQAFDVEAWAADVCARNAKADLPVDDIDVRYRTYIAATYRAAACLYVLLVAPGLQSYIVARRLVAPGDAADTALPFIPHTEDYVETILACLSGIPVGNQLFKYTAWPLFIGGVATMSAERRQWVHQRLNSIWQVCPWGMLHSAMDTLTTIWRLGDKMVAGPGEGSDKLAGMGEESSVDIERDCNGRLARLRGIGIDFLVV